MSRKRRSLCPFTWDDVYRIALMADASWPVTDAYLLAVAEGIASMLPTETRPAGLADLMADMRENTETVPLSKPLWAIDGEARP